MLGVRGHAPRGSRRAPAGPPGHGAPAGAVDAGFNARTADVHLGRLRAKPGPAGSRIETVFGLGCRFAENV